MVVYTEYERGMRFIAKIMLIFGLVMFIPLLIVGLTAVPLFWEKEGIENWQKMIVGGFLLAGLIEILIATYRLNRVVDYAVINPEEKVITHFRKKKVLKALNFADIDHLLINSNAPHNTDSYGNSSVKYFYVRLPEMGRLSIYENTDLAKVTAKAKELADLFGAEIKNETNASESD
ncbi:MAG: hypothetical protein ACQETH_12695 [Candidatus Rifleibacteriota bacterium]